jgi:hypothetical protein
LIKLIPPVPRHQPLLVLGVGDLELPNGRADSLVPHVGCFPNHGDLISRNRTNQDSRARIKAPPQERSLNKTNHVARVPLLLCRSPQASGMKIQQWVQGAEFHPKNSVARSYHKQIFPFVKKTPICYGITAFKSVAISEFSKMSFALKNCAPLVLSLEHCPSFCRKAGGRNDPIEQPQD